MSGERTGSNTCNAQEILGDTGRVMSRVLLRPVLPAREFPGVFPKGSLERMSLGERFSPKVEVDRMGDASVGDSKLRGVRPIWKPASTGPLR